MKKAKVFLGAIAVLAIVGGALAFKTATFVPGQFIYTCITPAGEDPVCSISKDGDGNPVSFTATDVSNGGVPITEATFNNVNGQACLNKCDDQFTITVKPE